MELSAVCSLQQFSTLYCCMDPCTSIPSTHVLSEPTIFSSSAAFMKNYYTSYLVYLLQQAIDLLSSEFT